MDKLVAAAIVWCSLLGLYLLLAGTLSATEIGAGLAAATVVLGFLMLVRANAGRAMALRPGLPALARPLLRLPADTLRVGRVLLAVLAARPGGMVGAVVRQPFRHGGDAPRDAGRRGLAVLAASLAPNGYGLHIPDGEDVLVMHRLAPAAPGPDRDWPT